MKLKKRMVRTRRGAVAVEFAVVAPVLIAIFWGLTSANRTIGTQNLLAAAAREGARFGAMDRTGVTPDGMTSNEKLIQDVKNFLDAQGVPADDVVVSVKHAGTDADFDLDDAANDMELFEVRVELPYSSTSLRAVSPNNDWTMTAAVTFRNARATFSE